MRAHRARRPGAPFVAALALALGACAQMPSSGRGAPASAGPASAEVSIGGMVANPQVVRIADLPAACTVRHIDERRTIERDGRKEERVTRYSGCLVRELLDRAKPLEGERYDLRTSIVVATSTDGYRAVFSWGELWLSPIGDAALVIFQRNGTPLGVEEGPIALRSLNDLRPGPRSVRWLRSIELQRVPPASR